MSTPPLKILLDQGLPRSAAKHLRDLGLDAVHVGDLGMATALDEEIILHGRDDGRVIVTLDADFHSILARVGASAPSVIRLRVQGLDGTEIATLILRVIDACGNELAAGAAVTADTARIRLRRLPIGG